MTLSIDELALELSEADADGLQGAAESIVGRVRSVSPEEKERLLRKALEMHDDGPSGTQWDPYRTLRGLILHAVDVGTVSSVEEERLREEIRTSLSKSHGQA